MPNTGIQSPSFSMWKGGAAMHGIMDETKRDNPSPGVHCSQAAGTTSQGDRQQQILREAKAGKTHSYAKGLDPWETGSEIMQHRMSLPRVPCLLEKDIATAEASGLGEQSPFPSLVMIYLGRSLIFH